MRHLDGESREQGSLLPDTLDDYVADDHPVRVIDAFIDHLDLVDLGFSKASTKATGRKPYNPADLLKLYVYGYLNQVRSSRRLEKGCHRNLEVIWLMKRFSPDFKTIADFRKENASAIKCACQAFIQFCRQADLLTGRLVAIDGSKFKAAASKDRALIRKQLHERRKRVERLVDPYLCQLAKADGEDVNVEMESGQVHRALERLEAEGIRLDDIESEIDERDSNQHCTTEPEAKLMRSGREGTVLGYNVQTAVDTDSGLIVHHEATDRSADSQELQSMAEGAKEALAAENLAVVADNGYSNGEQQAACEAQGIEVAVPSRRAVNNQSSAFFQKSEFHYDEERNSFICPAGEELRYTTYNNKDKMYLYSRTGCNGCALQSKCTKADRRWVSRHFHERAFALSEACLAENPGLMGVRMAAVERLFAVLKAILGLRRLLCRGMEGAKAETGLGILSYNVARMVNEVGVPRLLAGIR
jgi:transposase